MIGEPLKQKALFADLSNVLLSEVFFDRASSGRTAVFPLDFDFHVVLNSIKTSLVEATMLDDNDQAP